jgi:hypothetical protein
VEVVWHPGHPEKRKRCDKSDWSLADHAIFLADVLAEGVHRMERDPSSREPTEWSHTPAWRLYWRGSVQTGCIANRLKDAARSELLHRYLSTATLGPGSDGDWLLPELLSRTIGRKEGDMAAKVHRAKSVASILGTRYTQHRRNKLDESEDPLCRMCGHHLETEEHVMWECAHPLLGRARQTLSKAVRALWRTSGLGQNELGTAHLLWRLKHDNTAECSTEADIPGLLDPLATGDSHATLLQA